MRRTSRTRALYPGSNRPSPSQPPLPVVAESPRSTHKGTPYGTIIIPAHNEADVIERTLGSIAELAAHGQVEVIVVCNGCTDETAALARRFAGVVVHEIGTASKPSAMNRGDDVAHSWPRLYLDADIEIAPTAVLEVFEALRSESLLAVRPTFAYDTTGASLPVRSYYRARMRIPVSKDALWGAGGYALNATGHDRFGRFPELTADDAFVDGVFTSAEKLVLVTIPTRVRTPRHTAGLLAVLTRQRRGVVELSAAESTRKRLMALLSSVRCPSDAADVCWYTALTATARVRSRWATRASPSLWERDVSSRTAVHRRIPPALAPPLGHPQTSEPRASLIVAGDE
ncbi:glycosyltransferase [Cryobacterium sp. Hh7]|nr:glycosyltransferase [Cryobacterium sp. Hh7]